MMPAALSLPLSFATALALGFALALRFRVLILLPISMIILVVALAGGQPGAAGGKLLMAFLTVVVSQVGYILGAASSFWSIANRAHCSQERFNGKAAVRQTMGAPPQAIRNILVTNGNSTCLRPDRRISAPEAQIHRLNLVAQHRSTKQRTLIFGRRPSSTKADF